MDIDSSRHPWSTPHDDDVDDDDDDDDDAVWLICMSLSHDIVSNPYSVYSYRVS